MVQFNNIFALCKMNKPAGLVFWQQHCTLQHGTQSLRSPRWGLGTLQRWWHATPRGVEDEPDDIPCLQTGCFTGQAWGWLQRWLPHFFLWLGVPFCSRDIVSAANWSLSRLDEIKTALLYALNPAHAADAENPSHTQPSSFWGWRTGPACCYEASVPLHAEHWCQ